MNTNDDLIGFPAIHELVPDIHSGDAGSAQEVIFSGGLNLPQTFYIFWHRISFGRMCRVS
jgi:hypothetical protein